MADSTQRVAQNTTYLTMALVLQKVIAFFFFLFVARRLGGTETGVYVAAFAFSNFFGVLVDAGLSPVLIRELSRHPEKTESYVSASLALKLILAGGAYLLLLLSVFLLHISGASHPPIGIVAIAGLCMIVDSVILTGTSIFRSWQNLWFEAVLTVLQKIAVLAVGLVVLWLFPSAYHIALAVLIGSLASIVLLVYYVRLRLPRPWAIEFDTALFKELWSLAKPFAIAAVFAAAYAQLDSILLSIFKGSEAVGLYSVAAKTMNALLFIPSAFSAALLPAMSVGQESPASLSYMLGSSIRYLLIVGIGLGVGGFALADRFVLAVHPDFAEAALAVKILLPSLVLAFLTYPVGALLNATDKQNWQTLLIAGGTIANLLFNAYLIPHYSYAGASIAWCLTNVMLFAAGVWLVRRLGLHYPYGVFFGTLWRCIVAGILMGGLLLALHSLPLLAAILLGASVYGVAILVLRAITWEEIASMFSTVIRPPHV